MAYLGRALTWLPILLLALTAGKTDAQVVPFNPFGANDALSQAQLDALALGQSSTWDTSQPNSHNLPMLRLGVHMSQNVAADVQRLGATQVVIGNEPNNPDTGAGDAVDPATAVSQFDQYAQAIAQLQPSVQLIAPPVIGWSQAAGGSAWLGQWLSVYRSRHAGQGPPVAAWSLHLYDVTNWYYDPVCSCPTAPGNSATLLEQELQGFRAWLDGQGFTGAPILVSEFGTINCWANSYVQCGPQAQQEQRSLVLMQQLVPFLESVQASYHLAGWHWFQYTNAGVQNTSPLVEQNGVPTPLGQQYAAYARDWVQRHPQYDPTLDVNGDGRIDTVDALCILRGVALLAPTASCPVQRRADVNGDGHADAVDALCVLRYVAALPQTPACPRASGLPGARIVRVL